MVFGFLGFVPYVALRPRKTIAEREEDERAAALVTTAVQKYACPVCRVIVERDYAYCPNCKNVFQAACTECGAVIDAEWKRCAYCSTDVERSVKSKKYRPAVLVEELDELAEVIEDETEGREAEAEEEVEEDAAEEEEKKRGESRKSGEKSQNT